MRKIVRNFGRVYCGFEFGVDILNIFRHYSTINSEQKLEQQNNKYHNTMRRTLQ